MSKRSTSQDTSLTGNPGMSHTLDYATLETPRWRNLPPPPSFAHVPASKLPSKASNTSSPKASYAKLKESRAWEFAISPAKSLPMQAFMLYMSGGGVQIFSMGIVFMLLLTPFKNIAAINTAFAPFAPTTASPSSAKSLTTLPLQKVVYLLCNLLTLAVGLWKCRSMGLLPTGTGDWLAFESRGLAPEISLM